jgi:hypothetical protein
VVFALPSISAVLELCLFGPSWNMAVLKPVLTPFVSCRNTFVQNEGRYSQYQTRIEVTHPLYLLVTKKISLPYILNLDGKNGFTFYDFKASAESDGATLLEKRFSTESHIAKSLILSHRFIKNDSYHLDIVVSGPTQLLEEECPFDFSSHY